MTGRLAPVLIVAAAVVFIAVRLRRKQTRLAPKWRTRTDGVSGPVELVAGREVRQRLRGRAFRVATGLLLLGVAAAIVIPVATKGKTHPQDVGVVGHLTQSLRRAIGTAAKGVHAEVRIVPQQSRKQADAGLRAGTIDLALVDGDRVVVKHAPSSGDTTQTSELARAVAQLLGVGKAVRAAGLTAAQQAELAAARPLPITGLEPSRTTTAARSTATFGLIVLFILLSQYLSWTLIGVMEEKSSRVVEVLLSTIRPLHLLAGKVIGIGVVVFAQAAVAAGFALLLARAVGSDLLHGAAPLVLLSTVLWLVLGYAFYSWLYAAAGSMAERQDQVQSLAVPLVLPLVAAYVISLTVLSSGGAPPLYAEILAYLPPTAPFAMTALVGLDAVTWWQFTLSAVATAASVAVVAFLAAGVYRRAILRTGRRVQFREILGRASRSPRPDAR
ncbi:MAG TPA: ABC transporter permease [Jatrophihabitans sp.]|jgi:ABC-2 type transport system permease protein|nr:ABC transporter permease [Jatrophihabitans sp.]